MVYINFRYLTRFLLNELSSHKQNQRYTSEFCLLRRPNDLLIILPKKKSATVLGYHLNHIVISYQDNNYGILSCNKLIIQLLFRLKFQPGLSLAQLILSLINRIFIEKNEMAFLSNDLKPFEVVFIVHYKKLTECFTASELN